MVAVLALSAFVVLAAPAGASSSTPSPKFCTAISKIGSGNSGGGSPTQKEAARTYKQFKAAAKLAPSKVKSAGNKIASVLGKIATIKPSNAKDLANFYSSSDFKAYGKAVTTFFAYAATCTGSIP
ncbi:MAG: hypothetical protein ACHQ52_12985 [Candidatus Eisenbacteria bacterium]